MGGMRAIDITTMYTVEEAARAAGLTRGRICQMLRSGQIHGIKIGRLMWVIPQSEVRKIIHPRKGPGRPRSGSPAVSL